MPANKRPREEGYELEVIQKDTKKHIISLKINRVEIIEIIEDNPIDKIKDIKEQLDIIKQNEDNIKKQYEESIKNVNKLLKEQYDESIEKNNKLLIYKYNKLGIEYFNQKNNEEAIKYFTLSSDLNNSDAQIMLYYIIYNIKKYDSIMKQYDYGMKIFDYLKLSLDNNNVAAQYEICLVIKSIIHFNLNNKQIKKLEEYLNIKMNYETVIKYLELSANQNYNNAQYRLGKVYIDDSCIKQDYIKAFEYFEKSSKQNNKLATQQLSILYANGWGVARDTEKAKQYFKLSFNQSIPTKYSFMDKYK